MEEKIEDSNTLLRSNELCKGLHIPEPIQMEPARFKAFVKTYIDLGHKTPLHDFILQRVFFFDERGGAICNVRKNDFDEVCKGMGCHYGYTSAYFSDQTFEIDKRRLFGNRVSMSS
jgi:hypothetical protein